MCNVEKQQGKCTICEKIIDVDSSQELGKCPACNNAFITQETIQFLRDEPFQKQENKLMISGFSLTLVSFVFMFSMSFSFIIDIVAVIFLYFLTLVTSLVALGLSVSGLVQANKKNQNKGLAIGSIVASVTQIILATVLFAIVAVVWQEFLNNFN